jgi:hypothetical protein
MFGSGVLDIGIGLIFVYLMAGLICTAGNEALASLLGWRASNLQAGIRNLLDGPDAQKSEWMRKFYDHPLVQGLYKAGSAPSYIPSRTFALALTDLVLPPTGRKPQTVDELRLLVEGSPCSDRLKQVFRLLIDEAERSTAAGQKLRLEGVLDLEKLDTLFNQLQKHVEIWFNNSMERVSGWYKRRVQACTIAIAVLVAGALNVDSVMIVRHLAQDSALRSVISAEAGQLAQQSLTTTAAAASTGARVGVLQDRVQDIKALGIPLGWPNPDGPPAGFTWWLAKALGILLTAGAASLGAPFWFDVLNRFVSIRSSGKAPEETPLPPKQVPMPAPPGVPQGISSLPNALGI